MRATLTVSLPRGVCVCYSARHEKGGQTERKFPLSERSGVQNQWQPW